MGDLLPNRVDHRPPGEIPPNTASCLHPCLSRFNRVMTIRSFLIGKEAGLSTAPENKVQRQAGGVSATASLERWGHGNDPVTGLSEVY